MSYSPCEEVKPDRPLKITLKVQFVMKRTTAFQKIYKAVTNHLQVTPHSFRLSHDGERLNPDETTPDDLNFDDEEVLDHFLEGVGGSFDGQDSLKQNMAGSEDRMLDSIIINSQQENLGV
ncbi:hypothetical protein PCANC_02306 [Puccinia coronata f. sp. avenae]|uniref:Rad60/SUMO-like domain-containing protein n=1 Tax=Puccinia coronata f. sp. avenae TaxID=200324 RepID=A0A2N5VZC5_9BASI|nr:hypothetical protein PCANC_02306 [Puccinia coronata f. sp. avenae]